VKIRKGTKIKDVIHQAEILKWRWGEDGQTTCNKQQTTVGQDYF